MARPEPAEGLTMKKVSIGPRSSEPALCGGAAASTPSPAISLQPAQVGLAPLRLEPTQRLGFVSSLHFPGWDRFGLPEAPVRPGAGLGRRRAPRRGPRDRKSTRLNSSHVKISYA